MDTDYDQAVGLVGDETGRPAVLGLGEAVRLVIEDWEAGQQAHARLVLADGTVLAGVAAIRAVYDRPDFPHQAA